MVEPGSPSARVEPSQVAYWQRVAAEQAHDRQAAMRVAWEQVQQIAQCLRREFGATRVIAFGSLVRDRFTDRSDIDLAVGGIPVARYFEAVARANEFSERWVDLKPLEDLEVHFHQRVLETGIDVYDNE